MKTKVQESLAPPAFRSTVLVRENIQSTYQASIQLLHLMFHQSPSPALSETSQSNPINIFPQMVRIITPSPQISFLDLTLYYYFFISNKQTYIDSVNQNGSSTSIWTTKEGWCLALRARLSALELCVFGIWISSELWKLLCRTLMSSR